MGVTRPTKRERESPYLSSETWGMFVSKYASCVDDVAPFCELRGNRSMDKFDGLRTISFSCRLHDAMDIFDDISQRKYHSVFITHEMPKKME